MEITTKIRKKRHLDYLENKKKEKRWLAVIPRDNIPDKKDIIVCERHWPLGYPTLRDYGKERPLDPPSVFLALTKRLIPLLRAPTGPTLQAHAR